MPPSKTINSTHRLALINLSTTGFATLGDLVDLSQHARALLQAREERHTITESGDQVQMYNLHIGQGQRVQLAR